MSIGTVIRTEGLGVTPAEAYARAARRPLVMPRQRFSAKERHIDL